MQKRYEVVIVGAGHAGAQAAIALRNEGFTGSIALIGREDELPYERPALSKDYFTGDKPFERMLIRPEKFWAERDIDLLLGREVVAVDADLQSIRLRDGSASGYGTLVWAAGGSARKLQCPGSDLAGVHVLRTRKDVEGILRDLAAGASRAVIVGGGYVGLESAASLRKLGCEVTLLEAMPRLLARVAGPEIGEFYAAHHKKHGVDVRLDAMVEELTGDSGRVSGVRLADGTELPCQIVIVGVGISPEVEVLQRAGAEAANGIVVDQFCRTSLPEVYAIGDCAEHPNRFADHRSIRLESVQNANDMAATVAKHICGSEAPYDALPWFWSNQYDLKLQTVGLSNDYDETVLRGDPAEGSFSVVYLKQGSVLALDCVNAMKDYVQGRKMVEMGLKISSADLSNTATALKELIGSNT